ncbi:MAG: ClbS/DfsB family four-helix bundle protein [Dehalococcoidia bacterium]|nr:ClbS/DfsB family four-helix bundle protein [Dehalococcoidia bacterium]
MSSRDDLIKEFDAAFQDFRSVLSGLTEHDFDTKWLDKRWGVREIAAHFTGWLGQMAGGLERMGRGEKPALEGVDWTDVQRWNDTFAEHVKGKRVTQVLDELEHATNAFKQAAIRLPDERYGEGKTAYRMFQAVGSPHLREHTEMVRTWRDEVGPTAR